MPEVDPDAVGAAVGIGGPAGVPFVCAAFHVVRAPKASLRALTLTLYDVPLASAPASTTLSQYSVPTASEADTVCVRETEPTVMR